MELRNINHACLYVSNFAVKDDITELNRWINCHKVNNMCLRNHIEEITFVFKTE